jgi:lipopolysaccharide/colanic/teichoic acid biosynthesis glycosyltransferase
LADVPVLRFQRDTLYTASAGIKRLCESLLALVLLVLGLPGCMLYWLLAKLRSKPLFLWDDRLGRGACHMHVPRVNDALGLPPSDLVNLPAWIAVLRGSLSLVGPFPLPSEWHDQLEDWQVARFDVRPGITGFWRILRSEERTPETVLRMDLHYVRNWSMGLDFRLLLQSLGTMLLGRGVSITSTRPPRPRGGLQ